jgi:hypothetical protein
MAARENIFIENLRVLAIIAIILHHSELGEAGDVHYTLGYLAFLQLSKYGTITFMIISGYLFEKTLHKYSTRELIIRKFHTLLLPSLLFIFCYSITKFFFDKANVFGFKGIVTFAYMIVFYSIYWFIFNLFLIQTVNSYLKDIKRVKYYFIASLLITGTYAINIYLRLIPNAAAVVLSYFSLFFIGRYVSFYEVFIVEKVRSIINNKLYFYSYLVLVLVFYSLAVTESFLIQKYIRTDPANILRISNIVFSILLLVPLYKIKNQLFFHKIFPKKSVFLVYLIHPFVLFTKDTIAYCFGLTSATHGTIFIIYDSLYALFVIVVALLVAKLLLSNQYFSDLFYARRGMPYQVKKVNQSNISLNRLEDNRPS